MLNIFKTKEVPNVNPVKNIYFYLASIKPAYSNYETSMSGVFKTINTGEEAFNTLMDTLKQNYKTDEVYIKAFNKIGD